MSDMSKKARAANRAKATRITTADPHKRVDASSWTPKEPLNTTAKTGARPIRPRIYKAGGKVQGDRGPRRADKKPRGLPAEIATAKAMRNVPAENAEMFGKYHEGAYKKGGAAVERKSRMLPHTRALEHQYNDANYLGGTRPTGGRIARKGGGRAKGKTNINIVIAQPKPQPDMSQGPVRPPMGPPPQMPPPMPPGGPMAGPGGPPPMPPPGMPPMGRKDGGRTYRAEGGASPARTKENEAAKRAAIYDAPLNTAPTAMVAKLIADAPTGKIKNYRDGGRAELKLTGGAGGARGRLEKAAFQKRHPRKRGGAAMTAGAGSGEGRLQKIKMQERAR